MKKPAIALLLIASTFTLVAQNTVTNINRRYPKTEVSDKLSKLGVSPTVTYRTNSNLLYCTISCANLAERNKVWDAFRNSAKYAISATKEPPTVCVVYVNDIEEFQISREESELEQAVRQSAISLDGKIKEKIGNGYLVTAGKQDVLVVDLPFRPVDGDSFAHTVYFLDHFEYKRGEETKTVRKFTCDVRVAADHYKPLAADRAEQETRKRTVDKPGLP